MEKMGATFHQMAVEHGERIGGDNIRKIIKTAPHNNPGACLREHLAFTNYYRKRHEYFYSKKDQQALNTELVKRNIDLSRYKEMLDGKRAFERSLSKPKKPKKNCKGSSKLFFRDCCRSRTRRQNFQHGETKYLDGNSNF